MLVVFFYVPCYCQVRKVFIKGDFHDKPLKEFLREIEQKHNVQFYYSNEVIDKVMLNGSIAQPMQLLQALELLLGDNPVACAANGDGQIVLFSNPNKSVKPSGKFYTLKGKIKDSHTGEPLSFVSVYVPGVSKGTVSDANGNFEILLLPGGSSLVRFSFVGYESKAMKVDLVKDTFIEIDLKENITELQEIIITPSIFEISSVEGAPLTLGKEEILHSPNMSKDIYRTLRALPGIANHDYSAKPRIRGGHSDETAVYLDNFLINDPFHLEEIDGSFSIFNTDYVDELTVLTGGFSAKYTDRLSGIIDVKTSDHIDAGKYRLSLDLLNLSFLAQQRLNDKVNVFLTARKGYLDYLLSDIESEDLVQPRFSDFWSKVSYKPNDKNILTFNTLIGHDNFHVKLLDDIEADMNLESIRNNLNSWMNWKWFPSKKFSSISTIGYQSYDKDASFFFPENLETDNADIKNTQTLVLTNNTFWEIASRSRLEAGMEYRHFDSRNRYHEVRRDIFNSTPDNIIDHRIDLKSNFDGYTTSVYAQFSYTVTEGFILQPGVRASLQRFTTGLNIAPRFAMSYALSPAFNVRLAYGVYYQPDMYFKLRTSLLQAEPYGTMNSCNQYTGAITYTMQKTSVMLNVYHKEYDHLFDDYRYEFFNRVVGIGVVDVPFGTVAGNASGAEIMVRRHYGNNSMVSVSYAYSKSVIRNYAGQEAPRDYDQPHTIIVNNIFRLPHNWNISFLWNYHTGYPYTPKEVDFISQHAAGEHIILHYETGQKNSRRLPDFSSVDVRVEKTWHFRKNTLMAYLNIVNLFDHDNVQTYAWYSHRWRQNSIRFRQEASLTIPFFISPGISFTLF